MQKKVVQSKSSTTSGEEELEEVEVTAQISIPPDGGWGWVVVITSFFVGFANDGTLYTFGALLGDISKDLRMSESVIALINSVTVACYYCSGPLVSGLINRFGFRLCAMMGAVMSSLSCFFTYLIGDYTGLIIFYGFTAALGYSMANMSSQIIVGFYFQKWRSIAFTLAVVGCSCGIMAISQLNTFLTRTSGWKTAILCQSTYLAFSYFICMAYRPVLSLSVIQTTEANEPTKTVTYLPTISKTKLKSFARVPSSIADDSIKASPAQKLFNAVSNVNYPTAQEIIEEAAEESRIDFDETALGSLEAAPVPFEAAPSSSKAAPDSSEATPSISEVAPASSKAATGASETTPATATEPFVVASDKSEPAQTSPTAAQASPKAAPGSSEVASGQTEPSPAPPQATPAPSMTSSKPSVVTLGPSVRGKSYITIIPHNKDRRMHEKQLSQIKLYIAQSQANLQKKGTSQNQVIFSLPERLFSIKKRSYLRSLFHWEKHVSESRPMYRDDVFFEDNLRTSLKKTEEENALDYQLKVSRAAAASDLKERRGVFTTAFRRVLVTMLDPKLLKRRSFLTICVSMFMIYIGYLIPMVYVTPRGKELGIDPNHCSIFLAIIGFSGILGRLIQGVIALKIHPLNISISVNSIAGISTMISGFGTTATLQCVYCFIYGFTTSSSTTIRALTLVKLYGIENLTNCTGIVVLFQGIGCLLSTPVAGILKDLWGYHAAFFFSGSCLTIGGLLALPVAALIKKENKEAARAQNVKMPRTRSVIIKG